MSDFWWIGVALLGALGAAILILSRRRSDQPAPPGDTPDVVETLDELRDRFGRPAFVPQIEPGDAGPSQFGGRPWLAEGERWPECGHCQKPMQLLLQLDLDALPAGAPPQRSGGLLQLFYCTCAEPHCETEAEGWEPFAACHLQRIVFPADLGERAHEDLAALAAGEDACEPHTIVGWSQHDDLPTEADLAALPAILGADLRDAYASAQPEELTRPGHKLGGWPLWIQAPEYPACPECGEAMEYLFQIDSLDTQCELPVEFGDSGSGHVTRCRTHTRVIGFGWACA